MVFSAALQLIQPLTKLSALLESIEPITVGDAMTRCEVGEGVLGALFREQPRPEDLSIQSVLVKVVNGKACRYVGITKQDQ